MSLEIVDSLNPDNTPAVGTALLHHTVLRGFSRVDIGFSCRYLVEPMDFSWIKNRLCVQSIFIPFIQIGSVFLFAI